MSALAAGTNPALLPAIIGAAASLVSAILLAVVAFRAQSAKQQLDEIRKVIEAELDDPGRRAIARDMVTRALREVLGSHAAGRRWYDSGDDD